MEGQVKKCQKPRIYWVFFWASGVATLFVWSAVVSQTDYLKNRFRQDVDKIYPFYNFLGGLLAMMLYRNVFCRYSVKQRITRMPPILVAISIAIYYTGEYMVKSSTKFYLLMAMCFADGFFSAVLQTTLIAYSFLFARYEISYCSAGGALVAIIINVVAFVNEISFEENRHDIKGLLYLVFQISTLSILMIIFGTFASACPKDLKKGDVSKKQLDDALKVVHMEAGTQMSQEKLPNTSLWKIFMHIHSYFFSMFLTYTITLSVYPGLCLDLGLNWSATASSQIIMFIFNLFDCIGKYAYALKKMPDNWVPRCLALLRVAFIIFAILVFGTYSHPEFTQRPLITVIFTLLLGLSNGYLTAGLFSLSAESCLPEQRDGAGYLMTLALTGGLCYGALCTTLSTSSN